MSSVKIPSSFVFILIISSLKAVLILSGGALSYG